MTRETERDLAEIARHTVATFGPGQAQRYAALIERGLIMLCDDPFRPSSKARDELAPAVRSFHLSQAASRRHAASHVVYYHCAAGTVNDVIVLRVLHERMEPKSRLVDAKRRDDSIGRKP